MSKPILLVDFDGTIHPYTAGWKGEAVIDNEPPTEGFITWLRAAVQIFSVHVYSSRSKHPDGLAAMQAYLQQYLLGDDRKVYAQLGWPTEKLGAFLTIDDRSFTFKGRWPDPAELIKFKPWNKGG